MAKFISKSANLNIILRPGLSAQPLLGSPGRPAISVRFQNGIAIIDDQELAKMMLLHPGFNKDFISADEVLGDPYAHQRQDTEPQHIMTELKHGTAVGRVVGKGKNVLPPEIAKLVNAQALAIAKELLPKMVEDTLKKLVQAREENKKNAKDEDKNTVPNKAKTKSEELYEA